MSHQNTVNQVEDFLLDLVTQTPLLLEFTAAMLGRFHGVSTQQAGAWLQEYRTICTGRTAATAQYSIGCWQRGNGSVWTVNTWPSMTNAQRERSAAVTVAHRINSLCNEHIKPYLRNIYTELIPAILGNRMNRTLIDSEVDLLRAEANKLTAYRRDIAGIRPVALRATVRSLDALLGAYVTRVDSARRAVNSLR